MYLEEEQLRYPIGRYVPAENTTTAWREERIKEIAGLPGQLREEWLRLAPGLLDTPYRPGGWTARQVMHHVADSHMNSWIRMRLALTEEDPLIKPYEEHLWAQLPDSELDPEISLCLLEALHERWAAMLRSLPDEAFSRTFRHPDIGRTDLKVQVGLYAWHGLHHLGHLRLIR